MRVKKRVLLRSGLRSERGTCHRIRDTLRRSISNVKQAEGIDFCKKIKPEFIFRLSSAYQRMFEWDYIKVVEQIPERELPTSHTAFYMSRMTTRSLNMLHADCKKWVFWLRSRQMAKRVELNWNLFNGI